MTKAPRSQNLFCMGGTEVKALRERFCQGADRRGASVRVGLHGQTDLSMYGGLDPETRVRHAGYPFHSQYYDRKIVYKPGLCPVTERKPLEAITVSLHECWTRKEIRDAAGIMRRGAASDRSASSIRRPVGGSGSCGMRRYRVRGSLRGAAFRRQGTGFRAGL